MRILSLLTLLITAWPGGLPPLSGQSIPSPHLTTSIDASVSSKDGFTDRSGSLQSTRAGTGLSYWQPLAPGTFGVLSGEWHRYHYRFPEGGSSGPFTFSNANSLQVQVEVNRIPLDRFGFFLFLQLNDHTSDEASIWSGLRGFGAGGPTWKARDNLILGMGVAYGGNLLDDNSLFPIPFIFWTIDERWSLLTRNGFILRRQDGPWTLAGEALYFNRQFALGQTGNQSRGALEDSGLRTGIRARYAGDSGWRVEAALLSNLLRTVEVRREDRTRIFHEDTHPGAYAELKFGHRF